MSPPSALLPLLLTAGPALAIYNQTLRDQATEQVEFHRARGVTAPQLYIFDQQKYGAKVAAVREFKNTKEKAVEVRVAEHFIAGRIGRSSRSPIYWKKRTRALPNSG